MRFMNALDFPADYEQKQKRNKEKAMKLYMRGKYKEVCEFVDELYGWPPGTMGRTDFSKASAEACLKHL